MAVTSSTISMPPRSLEQRLKALERANEVRTQRSRLKRDLKAGWQPVAPLLLDPPRELHTMKLFDLLLAVPRVGRVRANRYLRLAGVSPSKTVGGLTVRQRRELAALVADSGLRATPQGRSGVSA